MTMIIIETVLTSVNDSLIASNYGSLENASGFSFTTVLDCLYKISMIAIAVMNYVYAKKLNIFKHKVDTDKAKEEEIRRSKDRRIDYLKTIVYEPNLAKLYTFLNSLEIELVKLKDKQVDRSVVEGNIQKLFTQFRSDFIIILQASVPSLGQKILDSCDYMRDTLVANISDEGVNLWVERYYNDLIKSVFEQGRTRIISQLFTYDGE